MMKLKGFTLIELLIVVAIIGILAAIAVPNFLNAQVRAKVARAESEIRSLQNSLESFFIDNNSYPPMDTDRIRMRRQYRDVSAAGDAVINIAHIAIGTTGDRRIYLTTPVAYISSVPYDPFRGDGNEYGYGYGSNGQSYYIMTSWGPDGQNGNGGSATQGGLDPREYTGARLSDLRRAGVRKSNFTLGELMYNPSNGTSSTGDILRVGP
ncbi:MAG: prepilin-type N-terminal cleavage/methylation domain-containing protein [Candidatus Omnitrophota bacterium]|jgi:prepilin-type N-terminal cleavage/methylation domain-containing protein|nr:MAG: prepilin-type N-terminal cleavage/methylation domain-containing protein [Candidatus Omnitrophota bacterium]